jgi:hypothetical protein
MRRVHRINKLKMACLKPFQVTLENIGFVLLKNSKNFFVLNLRSNSNPIIVLICFRLTKVTSST